MIMEGIAVTAVYFGFIAACCGVAAVVRLVFPKWFEEVPEDE